MFVNRSLIPYRHQQDWFDLTNHLLNRFVLLDDDILPRITRRCAMEDEWRLLESELQHQVNWNDPKKFQVKLDVTKWLNESDK